MENFTSRLAVVTGGGTGMGRELARQLAAEGCHVAMCDVSADNMDETIALCLADAPDGTRVTGFVADVSDEARLLAFRDDVVARHGTEQLHLLFNNAGIGGGGSFVADGRGEWEATFNVCWGGVYYGCRTFMPMLLAAPEAHIVNTSSVNGFWASLGPSIPHTAYSAAKFAVKGFSEALIADLGVNAPHVKVSVVMPGHIGTSIVLNSGRYFGREPKELTAEQVDRVREQLARRGIDVGAASDDDIRLGMQMQAEMFRDAAPMTAAQAAAVILDGVRNERWRILVGDDAVALDELVRQYPEQAYGPEFLPHLKARGLFAFATQDVPD
ncbi:MAG: SDR family oxidoreductase [Acidobacteria bacterium]|nr:SDR family oxidoreductase [Acidobacteriota bacterium]